MAKGVCDIVTGNTGLAQLGSGRAPSRRPALLVGALVSVTGAVIVSPGMARRGRPRCHGSTAAEPVIVGAVRLGQPCREIRDLNVTGRGSVLS